MALTEPREVAVTGDFNWVITALMQPESNTMAIKLDGEPSIHPITIIISDLIIIIDCQ